MNIMATSLWVRKVKLAQSILMAHGKALMMGNALYPIARCDVKTISLPQGITTATQENVFLGQLPTRVVIGFVSNAAYNGSLRTNPWNMRTWDLSYISLWVDGVQMPHTALQPNFDQRAHMLG